MDANDVIAMIKRRRAKFQAQRRLGPQEGMDESARLIAEEYVRLAFEAGLRTDIDPDLPFQMVVGTLLMSLLAEGVPPTPELALQTAEIVIEGLGVRATGPG